MNEILWFHVPCRSPLQQTRSTKDMLGSGHPFDIRGLRWQPRPHFPVCPPVQIHERTLDSDLLLLLVKLLLPSNPHLHVIIMSATMQPAIFSEYFANFHPKQPMACVHFGCRVCQDSNSAPLC